MPSSSSVLEGLRAQIASWDGPSYVTRAEAERMFGDAVAERDRTNSFAHVYHPEEQAFVSSLQRTQRLYALKKDEKGNWVIDHDRVEVWEAPHIHGVAWSRSETGRFLVGVTYQIRQFVNNVDDDRVMMSPPYIFGQPCAMGFNQVRVFGTMAGTASMALESGAEAASRETLEELGVKGLEVPRLIGKHVASNTFAQSWTPVYATQADHNKIVGNPDRSELIVFSEFLEVAEVLRKISVGFDGVVNWGAALPNMSFMKWLMTNKEAWLQASEGIR